MSGRLEGLVAIITGAGGGALGRTGAVLFAEEGARIVALDVREEGVEQTARLIREAGGEAIALCADVTRPADLRTARDAALEAFGRIDILWNNAAIMRSLHEPAEEITDEDWEDSLRVNLTGVFNGVKAVVPHMKERRSGVILNTASIAGLAGHMPGHAGYVASKGGVIAFTRQLALELGPFNIRANCLAGGGSGEPGSGIPGVADAYRPEVSPFGGMPLEGPESAMPRTDATRMPAPPEFAQAALFLVEPAAGPLTGVVLAPDGGRTSR